MRMVKYKEKIFKCPRCLNYYWELAISNDAIVCTICEYLHPAKIEVTIPNDKKCDGYKADSPKPDEVKIIKKIRRT